MPSTITDRLNGLTTSVAVKAPVRVATTANITLSGAQTIDGVAVAVGDRVLVKNQTLAVENGIWIVSSGTWIRAADFNGTFDAAGGTIVTVTSGTENANSYWKTSGTGAITIGTDTITFVAGLISSAASISAEQSGTGAIAETVQSALRRVRFAEQYGLSQAAGAAVNLAALKDAIAATPTGGRLIIGEDTFSVDVTGGLSAAVLIDRAMTIEVRGRLQANSFAIQANPYYMFKVTADDVTFTGNGVLAGNGTIDDANSGDTTTHPGLIYVEGDRFVLGRDLNMVDVPKVGVTLAACYDARIGGRWKGGPTVYGSTGYFGIIATGGARHIFEGCRAERDALGGRLVNFIFTSGVAGNANDCTVRNCYGDVWEKLFYGEGSGHYVHDNEGVGWNTDWIRLHGDDNRAFRNKAVGSKGGVSAYDGKNIQIRDNTFTGCRQVGIFVGKLTAGYAAGFSGLVIDGNVLIGDSTSGILASGLHVFTDGSDTSGLVVRDNRVENFGANAGDGLIKIGSAAPHTLSDVKVQGNKIGSTTKVGIQLDRVVDSVVENNTGSAITQYFLSQDANCARNRWINNVGSGLGSIGINGLDATSEGQGNRYTAAPLTGVVALSAAIVTNVAHGGVAPNARVFLQTANDAAGIMIVGKGWPTTSLNVNNFDIAMANGTAAAGTEQFFYRIEQ